MGAEDNEGKGEEGSEDQNKPKSYDQKDVDRIVRGATAKAGRSAVKTLLEEFGFESADELKAAFDKLGEETSNKKESDTGTQGPDRETVKRLAELEKKANKAEEAAAAGNTANLNLRVALALVEAGMDAKAARRAAKMVEVEADADDDALQDAIDSFQEDMPQLFESKGDSGESEGNGDRRKVTAVTGSAPRGSNPGGPPKQSKKPEDPRASNRARLERRHPQNFKK